jgi:hypothetical protein
MTTEQETQETVEVQETDTTTDTEQETQETAPAAEEKPDTDYRGKLNATHRFLEKEGYVFKDGKWHKVEKPAESKPVTNQTPAESGLTREEAVAYAQGLSEEEVEYAKKVKSVEGHKTLQDAIKSSLFTHWKKDRETEQRNKQAQLAPSNGSGGGARKTLATPGLTKEEHAALARERMNKR